MFENRQLAVFEGKCRRFRNSSECLKTHCGANDWPIWTQKVSKEAQRCELPTLKRFFSKIFWYTKWTVGRQKFVQYIHLLYPGQFILIESVSTYPKEVLLVIGQMKLAWSYSHLVLPTLTSMTLSVLSIRNIGFVLSQWTMWTRLSQDAKISIMKNQNNPKYTSILKIHKFWKKKKIIFLNIFNT